MFLHVSGASQDQSSWVVEYEPTVLPLVYSLYKLIGGQSGIDIAKTIKGTYKN